MIKHHTRFIPLTLFALTLLWYAALVFRFHTHGAIGDDPATYVQMALDLAQHGTVTHEFTLFTNLYDKGLSWDAFITPGYHVVRETGAIAPNFAFGFPLLLAFGYRVFGESALYWVTPLMGALSLVVTFALGNELWRELSPTRRYWIGAFAVVLLATTPKQIQLALVPMSDVPTQLFCVVAVWSAARVWRLSLRAVSAKQSSLCQHKIASSPSALLAMTRPAFFAALCGLSFGIAFLIRHSALVLIVPLAIVAGRGGSTKRGRMLLIFGALMVFVITILPDLLYRSNVLGSPFAVESPESAQTNFLGAPRQFLEMLAALFSITGFGPILLAALALRVGLEDKENRFAMLVLGAWILAFILFHAPLRLTGVFENNLRYLVPTYPAFALLIGRGMVALFEWGWNGVRALRAKKMLDSQPTRWVFALLCAIVTVLLFFLAIRALVSPERFVRRAYGWMSESARRDMNALNQELPRDAVIGVSDQMAGATMLYTQREIFRPANFLEPTREFPQFLQMMKKENRAVFLLGDWNCSPLAGASEMLPKWLEKYKIRDWRLEIGDLPYECAQNVYEVR